MLYIGYLIMLDGQRVKKKSVSEIPFLSCRGCNWSCPRPLGSPPPPHAPKCGEKHTKMVLRF